MSVQFTLAEINNHIEMLKSLQQSGHWDQTTQDRINQLQIQKNLILNNSHNTISKTNQSSNGTMKLEYSPEDFVNIVKEALDPSLGYYGVKECEVGKEMFVIWIRKINGNIYINIQEKTANSKSLKSNNCDKKLGLSSDAKSVFENGMEVKGDQKVSSEWRRILNECCKQLVYVAKQSTDQKTSTVVQKNTVPPSQKFPQMTPIQTLPPFNTSNCQIPPKTSLAGKPLTTGTVAERNWIADHIEVSNSVKEKYQYITYDGSEKFAQFLNKREAEIKAWVKTAKVEELINFLKATTGSSNLTNHLIDIELDYAYPLVSNVFFIKNGILTIGVDAFTANKNPPSEILSNTFSKPIPSSQTNIQPQVATVHNASPKLTFNQNKRAALAERLLLEKNNQGWFPAQYNILLNRRQLIVDWVMQKATDEELGRLIRTINKGSSQIPASTITIGTFRSNFDVDFVRMNQGKLEINFPPSGQENWTAERAIKEISKVVNNI